MQAEPNYLVVNKNVYESAQDFLISMVVPVFNAEQWIERCFLSICNQTYRNSNIECFFVDDCSQDNSAQILQDLMDKYRGEIKFSLMRQEKNCGAGACRNTGIRNSSGEYVIFVDADDEIAADSLLILAGLAQKYQQVDIVQGQAEAIVFYEGNIVKIGYYDAYFETFKFPEYTNDTVWIRKRMSFTSKRGFIPVTPWNKLIRKRFIVENNLYFSNIRSGQDLLWNFFASKYIKHIAFTANFTYLLHREHVSVIAKNQRTPLNRIMILEEMLKNINIETFCETVETVETELNHWIIPHIDGRGPEYYDLRKRVRNIRNIIDSLITEIPQYTPFNRISVIEKMLKNVNKETPVETVETLYTASTELNTWVIPYIGVHRPEYYDLLKRVRNIKNTIRNLFAEMPQQQTDTNEHQGNAD